MAVGKFRWRNIAAIVVPAVCLVLVWGARRSRQLSECLVCASNVKSVATTFRIYASNLFGFSFASSDEAIDAMLKAGVIGPEETRCPAHGKRYILTYPGGSPHPMGNRAAVAYEPLTSAHGRRGGNVCFADGHAQFVWAEEYQRIMDPSESPR